MGMLAVYIETPAEMIKNIKTKSINEVSEKLEELQEDEIVEVYDMDKMWDGLHFLLTGVSGGNAISDNPLSEAVMGTELLSTKESYEYIALIRPDRLKEIVVVLDGINTKELGKEFSPQLFAENNIYPDIWMYEAQDALCEELLTTFEELKEFYHTVADKNNGIIVSIG